MGNTHRRWLETAVFYEIYPQSFYDTNGDGIGDLQGIIQKLDYIKHLGCNAIWINPCFVSPFSDAGYDVADFYQVAPRYGTNDDMKRLFDEANNRGIRVCLDLVPGHTSIEHPWFKESCKAEKNKYSNWYVWSDSAWTRTDGDYYFISGHAERDASFMPNFFYFQPALNYGFANPDPNKPWQLPKDHPDVLALKEEIKNIIRFWLDMGASGFRVDMASSLVKNDSDFAATSAYWREVRDMLDEEYPEAALISEWSNPKKAISAGFDVDFLLHFGEYSNIYNSLFRNELYPSPVKDHMNTNSFFRKNGLGDINLFLKPYMEQYKDVAGQGYISIVSGNHDLQRLAQGRTTDELAVVFAFILTMPGIPFIYYGDEIGMDYIEGLPSKEGAYFRTGSRTPMQWNSAKNADFSQCDPSSLYLPVDSRKSAPNVESQIAQESSLLETVRRLIEVRKANPALCADGDFTAVYVEPCEYPFVYMRSNGSQKLLIAVNPAGKPVELSIQATWPASDARPLLVKGSALYISNGCLKLQMDGVSYGIFELE